MENIDKYKRYVLDKILNNINMRKWGIKPEDLNLWLSNFRSEEDLYFALHLLNGFIFYTSDEIVALCNRLLNQFFKAVLLEQLLKPQKISESDFTQLKKHVLEKTVFTHLWGEHSKPSDSGAGITKFYRQIGIPEELIFYPFEVPKIIAMGDCDYVVFVDDLIGSGTQACTFWGNNRLGTMLSKSITELFGHSYEEIADSFSSSVKFYYLALVATKKGLSNVQERIPNLKVIAGEILDNRQNVFGENSMYWESEEERTHFLQYYNNLCERLNISENRFGFGGNGLAIAFSHCVPDNILPIFSLEENGWNPLLRREK